MQSVYTHLFLRAGSNLHKGGKSLQTKDQKLVETLLSFEKIIYALTKFTQSQSMKMVQHLNGNLYDQKFEEAITVRWLPSFLPSKDVQGTNRSPAGAHSSVILSSFVEVGVCTQAKTASVTAQTWFSLSRMASKVWSIILWCNPCLMLPTSQKI